MYLISHDLLKETDFIRFVNSNRVVSPHVSLGDTHDKGIAYLLQSSKRLLLLCNARVPYPIHGRNSKTNQETTQGAAHMVQRAQTATRANVSGHQDPVRNHGEPLCTHRGAKV